MPLHLVINHSKSKHVFESPLYTVKIWNFEGWILNGWSIRTISTRSVRYSNGWCHRYLKKSRQFENQTSKPGFWMVQNKMASNHSVTETFHNQPNHSKLDMSSFWITTVFTFTVVWDYIRILYCFTSKKIKMSINW